MGAQFGWATTPKPVRVGCLGGIGGRLSEILRDFGEEIRIEFPAGCPDPAPGVALVALAERAASADDLALITRLASTGWYVVVCGEDTVNAPLSERCQLLLAGAREILDSRSPAFAGRLLTTLRSACEQVSARLAERDHLLRIMRDSGVIGESESLIAVFRSVDRLAGFSDLPVLIMGETGTGKDLVAQSLHRLDAARSRQPFVPVNCGALDLELASSGLFGHRRGSFTGASQDRPGLFRAAHRGTLFLDEIGELTLPLQAKLLRVLQTGRVLGVGDDQESKVDVRVIAATNRDLRRMIREGSFREDLFHRLSVTTIQIPPLRERTADIAPLVAHFLQRCEAAAGGPPLRIAPEVLRLLGRSRLSGNARQVENLVHHMFVYHEHGSEITLRDLPSDLLEEVSAERGSTAPAERSDCSFQDALLKLVEENDWNLERSLGRLETLIVNAALRSAGGNQSQAARKLGITPRSVYNKLRRSA